MLNEQRANEAGEEVYSFDKYIDHNLDHAFDVLSKDSLPGIHPRSWAVGNMALVNPYFAVDLMYDLPFRFVDLPMNEIVTICQAWTIFSDPRVARDGVPIVGLSREYAIKHKLFESWRPTNEVRAVFEKFHLEVTSVINHLNQPKKFPDVYTYLRSQKG